MELGADMTYKQFIGIALLFGCSALGLINMICAIVYGTVFLTRRGFHWVDLTTDPLQFWWSLGASVVCFLGLGSLGGLIIWSLRIERRFLDRQSARPQYEDSSHRSTL